MLDSARKRTVMIEHLEAALGLAEELSEAVAGYLIERALDEARAGLIPGRGRTPPPSR